ncbi:uncharacterized protein LOC134464758 [Engraulis encrasicolus]|uniref:uncharacterized protein LOC134464758 n=1 Tax=Engraulis encrasicolus TaxID=184585 RepID=UPI002FD3740B
MSLTRRRKTPLKEAEHYISLKEDTSTIEAKFIDDTKGRGVFSNAYIEKDAFVVEYRGKLCPLKNLSKKANLEYVYTFKFNDMDYCIDASQEDGTLGRLINDSPTPNCRAKIIRHLNVPHICIFAKKNIAPGDEITYDYGVPWLPWRTTKSGATEKEEDRAIVDAQSGATEKEEDRAIVDAQCAPHKLFHRTLNIEKCRTCRSPFAAKKWLGLQCRVCGGVWHEKCLKRSSEDWDLLYSDCSSGDEYIPCSPESPEEIESEEIEIQTCPALKKVLPEKENTSAMSEDNALMACAETESQMACAETESQMACAETESQMACAETESQMACAETESQMAGAETESQMAGAETESQMAGAETESQMAGAETESQMAGAETESQMAGAETESQMAGAETESQMAGAETESQMACAETESQMAGAETESQMACAETESQMACAETESQMACAETESQMACAETESQQKITLFNRRRSGEVSEMTMENFINRNMEEVHDDVSLGLTDVEKKLCKRLNRVELEGKRGRKVAIILTPSMLAALSQLVGQRRDCGVKDDNPYLFAVPHCDSCYRGHDCFKMFAHMCGAGNPDLLTSTNLRKHIATMSQIINLKENELDFSADFFGHNIKVHREYYRLPHSTIQVAKMSKLLIAMEKGDMGSLQGKSLDEIGDDLQFSEEDESTADEDDMDCCTADEGGIGESEYVSTGAACRVNDGINGGIGESGYVSTGAACHDNEDINGGIGESEYVSTGAACRVNDGIKGGIGESGYVSTGAACRVNDGINGGIGESGYVSTGAACHDNEDINGGIGESEYVSTGAACRVNDGIKDHVKSRRSYKKKPWTKDEILAVQKHLGTHIMQGKPATLSECEMCRKAEWDMLKDRTNQNIRDFVRNRGKKPKSAP